MRRLILFCILTTLFVSCSKEGGTETPLPKPPEIATRFLHSFVPSYISFDKSNVILSDIYAPSMVILIKDPIGYSSPDVYKVDEEGARAFEQIAQRNGDTSFNREDSEIAVESRRCFAENFKEIHLVCTNQNLDSAHPAGALLDDIVRMEGVSYNEYVRSGYQEEYARMSEYHVISKRLSEVSTDELAMLSVWIGHGPYFHFPDGIFKPGVTYELKVTMITTEGMEKTVTGSICLK